MKKISVTIAKDIDHKNAYTVVVDGTSSIVWTNDRGCGLWVDGRQVEGTGQFSAGRNPREAIRRWFRAVREEK